MTSTPSTSMSDREWAEQKAKHRANMVKRHEDARDAEKPVSVGDYMGEPADLVKHVETMTDPPPSASRKDALRRLQRLQYQFHMDTPDDYKCASLLDFNDATQQNVKEWMTSKSWLLYLQGDTGTGKTHLAFATAYESITLNLAPASWMSTPDLFADLRSAFDKPFKRIVENVRAFKGLLMLDDVGAGKDTEFSIQELYRVLYYREAWRLKTIVTTNYTITELAEKLDDRIASRLAGGHSINLKGSDRRLQKGAGS